MPDQNGGSFPVEHTVEEDDVGERLDRYLGRLHQPRYSRSYLSGLIREGRVLVNGAPEKPSYRLGVGDLIRADLGPPPAEAPPPEPVDLRVVYEDLHIAVIDKPAGLLVHPVGPNRGGTLVNGLIHRYPVVTGVGVVIRPGIVHRLDRFTSGVLVVALSNPARLGLMGQFRERSVRKEYRAIVEGRIALHSDYIDLPIGEHPRYRDRMRIDLREGKSASTFYEVLERFEDLTYVRVRPLTGRTHQIRVHMAHLGHPVAADPLYGGRAQGFVGLKQACRAAGQRVPRLDRQALHAYRLQFTHPIDGRLMEFTSPLPDDLSEVLEAGRAHSQGE